MNASLQRSLGQPTISIKGLMIHFAERVQRFIDRNSPSLLLEAIRPSISTTPNTIWTYQHKGIGSMVLKEYNRYLCVMLYISI